MRFLPLIVGTVVLAAACTANQIADSKPGRTIPVPTLPAGRVQDFGEPPEFFTGPLAPELEAAIAQVFGKSLEDGFFDVDDRSALDTMGASGDVRAAWLLSDLLRFVSGEGNTPRIARAASDVMGVDLGGDWQAITDHLIAWDVPAPPNYFDHKKSLYTIALPAWEPLFDETSTVDWRLITWGGVLIDDQPFGQTTGNCRRCIPAVDNPAVTDAAGGDWYPDERVVFGVEINGESRAYPKNIMEIREMVNDSLGGRDFGMPYCTLCGSAQVFFTDDVGGFDRPILRSSGLLSRSNKVMFDLTTKSVFDTFLGEAVTGPLADAGIVLPQANVVTATWGAWKAEYPETTILAEELALDLGLDPLRGRDDDGPIFPIGEVDSRLPAQEKVLGVVSPETGAAFAFHVASAVAFLAAGGTIDVAGISIVSSGGGIEAVDSDGDELGGHEAFWFAWSQFHPTTQLWPAT